MYAVPAMLALYFAWYNFYRVHKTLRVTPAMEAGISDHVWEIKELLEAVGCTRRQWHDLLLMMPTLFLRIPGQGDCDSEVIPMRIPKLI
jgi:hypothetical protein